ncbi:flagellar protein FlaG [Desulfurivibrio alkaliphilus]|uniref:Flagellar protein FlaG protein n=1 Tax=Desulfurivibrio alkaliphilus (strain DSM 19089 / UNIQEM U267 / AHT2) TaxID=589865 RepID=D6Z6P4_DESAT|nr:flagellar protein FlaG [Desulfurivibrio alkaliphilus]ADH85003.1 flagellar protein FlaG protein [Desulfurivibrio alkaliphilus AHT 2]
MDVNLHNEAKSYGLPAATAVEREEKNRPPVTPVADSGAAAKGKPEDRSRFDQPLRENRQVSPEEAEELAKEMQARLDSIGNTRLNFSLHRDPEAVVVQVTDRKSGDVIKQFPAEESLALRQKLNELVGMLFDGKA